jgi:hypothetical protein
VVIAIKRATREALARAGPLLAARPGDEPALADANRAVVAQAVTAAVRAYYAEWPGSASTA